MSCHDIGRGVDFIISKVLKMYDDGKISHEAAQEMLYEFPSAVNYCDGNDYEALETLTETHCARCLKKYKKGKGRITLKQASDEIKQEDIIEPDKYKISWSEWWFKRTKEFGTRGRSFCPDCFKAIFKEVLSDEAIERIMTKEKEAE